MIAISKATRADAAIEAHLKTLPKAEAKREEVKEIKAAVKKFLTDKRCQVPEDW